jgi:hypothetical protein
MIKIAITGQANTGKNTLARMLVRQIRASSSQNKKWISAQYLAFADPIKEMGRIMFPTLPKKFFFGASHLRDEIIPGAYKEGVPLTIRQLLIDIGTGLGRGYQDSIWLNNFDHRLSKIWAKVLVVTDVRFRNEFDHLRDKGFYQIRLYRKTGKPTLNHASETSQATITDEEFDCVLHNDGKLSDLKFEVIKNIIPNLKYNDI